METKCTASRILRYGVFIICTSLAIYFLFEGAYARIIPVEIQKIQKDRLEQKDSNRPCTFGLFRKVFSTDHYFPSGGKWVVSKNITSYEPRACKFKYPRVAKSFMDICLTQANLTSVLTMGDSTGIRYFDALKKGLGFNCKVTRREKLKQGGFLPDKDYFISRISPDMRKFVKVNFRYCSGCAGQHVLCQRTLHGKNKVNFSVEHIAQTMILDDSVAISFPNYQAGVPVVDKMWALTSQEFIFRHYLNGHYPQVFLIFLPFFHAKHNMALKRLGMEIQYFKSLVEHYFPNDTKLIYMPTYSEFEKPRNNKKWKNHLFNGMLAAEKLNKMNKILYEILEPDLLDPNGRTFSFLDVFEVSLAHPEWCTDGVHMKPIWYENVMNMFWETYCNSVLLNDF